MWWIRRGLTKTYEAEKPLSTISHEILHTQLVLQRKIAMEDIYTSAVETIYIYFISMGDFNCWNSKCKMFNSQICISSKKVFSSVCKQDQKALLTKWFEKIMSYAISSQNYFLALWFLPMKSYNNWTRYVEKSLSFENEIWCWVSNVWLRRVRIVNAYCSFPLHRL